MSKRFDEEIVKGVYNRAEINNVIKEITEKFNRENFPSLEFSKIDLILQKNGVSRSELRESLQNNSRFSCDLHKIYRRKKYEIKNETELVELLKTRTEGIEENKELYDCYQSCKRDIENMKNKGNLRIIENKNEKRVYLFLKDDKYERKEYQDISEKIRKKWGEVIETEYSIKTKEIEITNKGKNTKKIKRRRNKRKIHNTWMKEIIDFEEISDDI